MLADYDYGAVLDDLWREAVTLQMLRAQLAGVTSVPNYDQQTRINVTTDIINRRAIVMQLITEIKDFMDRITHFNREVAREMDVLTSPYLTGAFIEDSAGGNLLKDYVEGVIEELETASTQDPYEQNPNEESIFADEGGENDDEDPGVQFATRRRQRPPDEEEG